MKKITIEYEELVNKRMGKVCIVLFYATLALYRQKSKHRLSDPGRSQKNLQLPYGRRAPIEPRSSVA